MNSVKKNATLNIIRQICTIIIPLITFPYATRVLQAENYGAYTFSASIVSYITLLAGLGVADYAVREGARIRNDHQSITTFVSEVFTLNILSTLLAYTVLFLLILFWKKLDAYVSLILVLSTSVFFTTLGTDWVNIIYEDYAYITKRYIICQLLSIIFLFLTVKDQDDVIFYAITTVIGAISANVANIVYVRKHFEIKPHICLNKQVFVHLTPILILFANAIASNIYLNSDVTILGILKDDYAVAIYGVSSKIYMMVKAVANAAIAVTIPRIASYIEQKDDAPIKKLYKDTWGSVILVIIPATVGLIALSGDIVMLISGQGYLEAAEPLIILSCALPFATSACLLIAGILIPYRKEKIALQLTIVSALMNIALNFLWIPSLSFNAAAITTLLAEILMFAGGFLVTRKMFSIDIKRELGLAVLSGGVIYGLCTAVAQTFDDFILRLCISVAVSGLFYLGFLCVMQDNLVYDTCVSIIKKRR